MTTEITFTNTTIFTSTWIPIGKSNMEAMNRFVGSHKRYTTPTEFGIEGQIEDLSKGTFQMKKHGVFLTPQNYNTTNYLHANIKEQINSQQTYGLSAYKSGLINLGVQLKNEISPTEAKTITGKLGYKITSSIFPILNDVQKSLISNIINAKDISTAHYKVPVYSLIKCSDNNSIKGTNSKEIFANHTPEIECLTDWVIHHASINNCHLFIGSAATLCIGTTNKACENTLLHLQFLQASNNTSQQLHAMLWSLRKKIHKLRESSKKGNYRTLKQNNDLICDHNSRLLKIKTFDELLRNETKDMTREWEKVKTDKNKIHNYIQESYLNEVEKTENRSVTIEQLSEDLDVLSTELESRLDLIMTRDSMTLNIILLALTIISLLGVGEIAGFSNRQWKIVALFLIPFGIVSLIYLRNFLKNFLRRQ